MHSSLTAHRITFLALIVTLVSGLTWAGVVRASGPATTTPEPATAASGRIATVTGSQLVLLSQSQLWLEGTSTLHAYSARASRIKVSGSIPAASTPEELEAAIQAGNASLELIVPVKGLQSEKSGLAENLHKTMNAEKYPDIRFRLTGYRTQPGSKPGVYAVRATGKLAIAGVEQEIELDGTLTTGAYRLQLKGSRDLKMTAFGIQPPVMFMGALKTGDRVVVHYDLTLGLK